MSESASLKKLPIAPLGNISPRNHHILSGTMDKMSLDMVLIRIYSIQAARRAQNFLSGGRRH
jgi:hypothetical protein